MVKPRTLLSQLTDAEVLSDLARLLRANDPEFPPCEGAYYQAVSALQAALDGSGTPNLEDALAGWRQEVLAHMVYAGYLGFQSNLGNFRDPMGCDFVFQDDSVYLKEHIMERFPVCLHAANTRHAFRRSLPEGLQGYYDAISRYFIFLDLYGKKLAHYAGYIFGNELLPWVEPGYQRDITQTSLYRSVLERYFSFPLPF